MKSVNSHSEIGWKLINGNEISRENNFDLIRLFAALQVLLGHGINHLQILGYDEILDVISFFPGVMVFFVISGFLITRSYINCSIKKSMGWVNIFYNISKIGAFGFFRHYGLHLF